MKELKIDKAVYLVNETKSYRFLRRNLDWEKLSVEENNRNKKVLMVTKESSGTKRQRYLNINNE